MFRIYELVNGKFRDISPAGGYPTEAAAIAAARTGYREHLIIVIGGGNLIGAIYGCQESVGTPTSDW